MGKLDTAPMIYEVQHGPTLVWRVYDTGRGYDLYAVIFGIRLFQGTYRTRFFAKRRCRRGH